MQKWTFVLTGFLIVLSFQNCQKSAVQDGSGASSSSAPTEYKKSSASDFSTLQMWNYQEGKNFDIDLSTGRIMAYSNFGGELTGELCLNDAERHEVQMIVSNSEICQPVVTEEQFLNKQCTMIYQYPYAVLIDGSVQVRLGEKTNGCDVPTDLCGAQGQALQDFVQRVLKSVEQRGCQ